MREHASTPHSILGILLTTLPLRRAILSVSTTRSRKGALRPGAVPALSRRYLSAARALRPRRRAHLRAPAAGALPRGACCLKRKCDIMAAFAEQAVNYGLLARPFFIYGAALHRFANLT